MSKTTRIFVACTIGAFIGSIVALQMYHAFWWVGAVVGAFVAYLGYNIEEVIAAIPVAYRRTANWRPNSEYWFLWRTAFVCMFNLTVNSAVGVGLVAALAYWLFDTHGPEKNRLFLQFEAIIMLAGSIGLGTIFGLMCAINIVPEMLKKGAPYNFPTVPNVFRFYFWMLPRGIVIGSLV